MNVAQITNYFNIGLLVLFILLAVGLGLAALRGFRRGVWKSTHNMIFMLGLVLLAFFTLNALTELVGSFDLSPFIKGDLYISREIDGEWVTYYVPVTSVKETLTNFIQGFYTLFNVAASAKTAANFALALASSALKIVLFIIDMILIVTLGNLLSFLMWFLVAQHFVPRIARKLIKIRWLGMIETMVTFIVVTFLFMTPLTSLLNSLNQSYQKNRPTSENEMVMNIGNFVDAYNNSLFAQIIFNWTVDESGMTLDVRLFDSFTTGVSEDVSIGLVGELANITNMIIGAGRGIVDKSENEISYDPTLLISKEYVDMVFDVLINSDLINTIFPIVLEVALNSDVLEEYIPSRLIDISDVKWSEEVGYVKDMVDCVFDSGVIDNLYVDEDGQKKMRSFEGNDLVLFIDSVVHSENFNELLNIFKSIDDSKILSKAVPALIQFLISSDTEGNIKTYLPLSWEELNEFSWGYECYILLDFLHKVITIDDDFVKAIFVNAEIYKPADGETIKPLADLVSDHIADFKTLLVGEVDADGNPKDVDSSGRTKVFENGQRIEGRNYCLFDMSIISSVLPTLLDGLFEFEAFQEINKNLTESDLDLFHAAVKSLNEGVRLKNYKKEFNAILDVVATVAEDKELLDSLFKGKGLEGLMEEEGNFLSIKETHIDYFQAAIGKMDKSSLLYGTLVPMLKSLLAGDDIASTFNDIGLRADVLVSAVDHDMKKEHHTLFTDFSSVLDEWVNLQKVFKLADAGGDANSLMDQLKDQETIDALTSILSVLYKNPIINPTPEATDTYEKNENLYGLFEYVFNMTGDMGLTVTRDTLRNVPDWDKEFDAFGKILQHIASRDILNATDSFSDGLTTGLIDSLRGDGPDDINLPQLFNLVDDSYIFSTTLGPFLDDRLGEALDGFLIDKENHVCFSNLEQGDWKEEGQSMGRLLDSLHTLVEAGGSDFLSTFDMTGLNKITDLNEMLHELAHSNIFDYIDEDGNHQYQFGQWIYNKIDTSLGNFTVNEGQADEKSFDLLADPKPKEDYTWSWDVANWGARPEDDPVNPDPYFQTWKTKYNSDGAKADTHYIAYRDFSNLTREEWCQYDTFVVKQDAFMAAHKSDLTNEVTYLNPATNDWEGYFGSDLFTADYKEVFEVDEISRVAEFLTFAMRIMTPKRDNNILSLNKIPVKLLDDFLNSLNDTKCMRISLYNFYRIASESIFNDFNGFSLNSAYNAYLVDVDHDIFDYEGGRVTRRLELDKLVDFYNFINAAQDKDVLTGGSFDISKLTESGFMDDMRVAIKDLNNSFVFHRKGSAVNNQLTVFQGLFNKMLNGTNDIKDIIYVGANSPKDVANASLYSNANEKIEYLVTHIFKTDAQIEAESLDIPTVLAAENAEIDDIFDCVNTIYTMEDKNGNKFTNPSNIDINNINPDTTIQPLLTDLNNSGLLRDCVPNVMYNMFIKDSKLAISSGGQDVGFQQVDPYYHYFYNDTVLRATPDYDAKYLDKDIASITNLITEYQEFNTQLAGKELSDRTTLVNLTGEGGALSSLLMGMHDSNLFHSPARNYDGITPYYTDKFNDNGYTLFEEMMSKVCSFVGLDTFAYDDTYALDHDTYGSASAKLKHNVKAITARDDAGTGHNYAPIAATGAWQQEVNNIMNLAHIACTIGTGDKLDVSNFELDKLAPASVKSMLTAVNASDLVGDAVPGFVSKGFTAINLGSLTTYDTVDYSVYRLSQTIYGGENGNAPVGSEIDNIYQVMDALYDDGTQSYATSMGNMTDFLKGEGGEEGLTGFMRFVYKSHIFNTSLDGVYDKYNLVDGHNITAQGILLYNSLGADLSAYIARDADDTTPEKTALDKIASLSKITHMHNYIHDAEDITYLVESKGLITLINKTDGNIDADTFTSDTSISGVKSKKALILDIIESSYNSTGKSNPEDYQRSAIVSEFISGVFNNILENQYAKLASDHPTYQYIPFAFGNDDAATLVFNDYRSLNVNERNGLEGILDSLDYINNPATMKANSAALKECFVKMGPDEDHNSNIARIIYLSEAHSLFLSLRSPFILDSHGEEFVPIDETIADETLDNNLYSYNNIYKFSFANYGQRIEDFLNDIVI